MPQEEDWWLDAAYTNTLSDDTGSLLAKSCNALEFSNYILLPIKPSTGGWCWGSTHVIQSAAENEKGIQQSNHILTLISLYHLL